MVWAATYATATEIGYKAGAKASATAKGAAYLLSYGQMAEGIINSVTKKNWSDAYTTLNDDVKGILLDCGSSLAAMMVINYDMSGFTSRTEAETMLDYLYNSYTRDIEILKEIKNQDFMIGA